MNPPQPRKSRTRPSRQQWTEDGLAIRTENKVRKYNPKNAIAAAKNSCIEAETGRLRDCAGLIPGPPRVRPGVLYSGLLAGANLTAASTALVRARGSAPLIVLIGLPSRKIMNVGMLNTAHKLGVIQTAAQATYAETPYCWLICCWESTSTFAKETDFDFEYLVERDSKVGAMALHGPHQSA